MMSPAGRLVFHLLTAELVCSVSLMHPWATGASLGRLGVFVNSRVGRRPQGTDSDTGCAS